MDKHPLQIFIENFTLSLLTLIKIALFTNIFIKNKCPKNTTTKTIVIGNGPSVNETIEKNKHFFLGKDLWGVNFLMKSELFTVLKPKYYVILSPGYWIKGLTDQNAEGRLTAFKDLAEKTTWEMILFVPKMAKKNNDWKKEISKNHLISIRYFNNTPIEGFRFINRLLYQWQWGLPRPHNVLIPCIKFAIDFKYKNIYLIGADHSWLKDIVINDDNSIEFTQRHFYDNKEVKPMTPISGRNNTKRNLGQLLMKFVYTLNSYFELKDYANYCNVKIINATQGSYVDAFERINIKDYAQKSV